MEIYVKSPVNNTYEYKHYIISKNSINEYATIIESIDESNYNASKEKSPSSIISLSDLEIVLIKSTN